MMYKNRLQFKQTDIHVMATLNHVTQIFSANFFGSSVTDLFPCKSYDIQYQYIISMTSEWKYISSYQVYYKWASLDFDDSPWVSSVGVFYSLPSNILYLRKVFTVCILDWFDCRSPSLLKLVPIF